MSALEQTEKGEARLVEDANSTTTGKESNSYAASTAGVDHREESRKAERRFVLKLDLLFLPLMSLIYLSAYLDRSNLGNARLQGLQATVLRGSDSNYSIALMAFYITYIVFSIPGTLLAKAISPSTSIALGILIWSIASTAQAGAFNPAGLYVCRLFIGVGEAFFGQAITLYASFWYLPNELAKRIGLVVTSGTLAGAFGGLISFGVSSIENSKISQWRILFLIEGIPSFLLAFIVYFFLPSRPHTAKQLTEDERTLALTRLNRRNLGEGDTGVDWRAAKYALLDWKTYVVSVIYSCMNLGLGSVSGFLPTIIRDLGYSNARAQLFTVPPYVVCLVVVLIVSAYSDRYQTRGVPIASIFCIAVVGWAILLGVNAENPSQSELNARYFGCICIVTAGYSNISLLISWVSANTGAETQRAIALGMLNAVGQALVILAAFIFPSSESPHFVKGTSINLAFSGLGLVLSLGMTIYYRMENRRRDRVEGGRPPRDMPVNVVEEYDLAKGFRYTP
ncbi:major facilitator superfamily domain-containing protein [Favolaschia claudopus]|uniref:Major facilitator superfamily domain-containing protein n=1 Tax=Favolaschia claudopus TaxID=2862362 RepID=A0AAW0C563_9AGAR